MYKLLIVEDENKTREALKACLDWTRLNITEIRDVSNGKQALSLMKEYQADLVISDIRMPEMDGIEMASQIRDLYPSTNVIIVSAYSEVSYLKSAIKIDAIDYLLKPYDSDELEQAVITGLRRLEESEKKRRAESVLLSNLPLLREQWFRYVINSSRIYMHEWTEKKSSYHLDEFDGMEFVVISVDFQQMEGIDSLIFKQVVLQQLKAIVKRNTIILGFSVSFQNRDHELIIVGGDSPGENTTPKWIEVARAIEQGIIENGMHNIYVRCGPVVDSLMDINKSYAKRDAIIAQTEEEARHVGYIPLQERDTLLVQSIKKIIEKQYWSENLTVNSMADDLSYTSAYLCTIFKKATGITVNNYVNLYRIKRAKELLNDVTLKVADVSALVGFTSENYFSKVFKKYEGYSPSEYKRGG